MEQTDSENPTGARSGKRRCPRCSSALVHEGLVSKRYLGRAEICESCGYRETM